MRIESDLILTWCNSTASAKASSPGHGREVQLRPGHEGLSLREQIRPGLVRSLTGRNTNNVADLATKPPAGHYPLRPKPPPAGRPLAGPLFPTRAIEWRAILGDGSWRRSRTVGLPRSPRWTPCRALRFQGRGPCCGQQAPPPVAAAFGRP
ncbi:hypothetical protein VFPBJ_06459 [Purpureocillium lilacinum]|uniref:Uncharacterized protein n=1 Tax=Purpureocillium lilacinum TaxID=33203 RepID=A0A179GLQ6_PURLI|nr:hypothetical protein VFPBJ_06459 [Purpureocillium lilacinum]